MKGLLFYRQKPLGKYIADFYCPKAKPVLEVDGGQHFTDHVKENDKVRDAILGNMGIKVLRSTNDDVMDNIDGVIEAIEGCLP